jgi:hypothetical protein
VADGGESSGYQLNQMTVLADHGVGDGLKRWQPGSNSEVAN